MAGSRDGDEDKDESAPPFMGEIPRRTNEIAPESWDEIIEKCDTDEGGFPHLEWLYNPLRHLKTCQTDIVTFFRAYVIDEFFQVVYWRRSFMTTTYLLH